LVGVTIVRERCSMVSSWMEHGTINEFIERDQRVDRVDLLIGIVNGLMYMHRLQVVHGDLKGENILIDKHRRACIADFGLSTIVSVDTHLDSGLLAVSRTDSLMSFISGGSFPWMSPELLDQDDTYELRPTKESDVYALGMLIYEVLCRRTPFDDLQNPNMIVVEIARGTRPKKPEDAASLGFTDELWGTLEQCWLADRGARPTLGVVLSCLSGAASGSGDR